MADERPDWERAVEDPHWEQGTGDPLAERDPFSEAEPHGLNRSPREWLRLWFGIRESVDARSYLVSGLVLAAVKYAGEALLIFETTGNVLDLVSFLDPSLANRQALIAGAPEWVGWVLLAWQLPFVWVAFSTSVRRCANAGLSPWLGMLVLIPYFNVLFMLVMSLVPTATGGVDRERAEARVVESYAVRQMAAIGAGMATFLAMFALGTFALADYGLTLFFATPLMMGVMHGYVYNRLSPGESEGTLGSGCLMTIASAAVLVLLAWEGLICIVMALPILAPLVLVGSVIGGAIANFAARDDRGVYPALLLLPTLAWCEAALRAPGPEHVVSTAVVIDAPPEVVWRRVVSFPDLPEPDEFWFRIGIACPLRARIEGEGVGAIRYCEFTTGPFVEPITVWDEPRRLAFDVTSQPHPMREVNPFGPVHAPHLENLTLRSRRGEFRLIALPGGRTRLEGRTWYTFDMQPRLYWTRWSQYLVGRIHHRVLEHVKHLAERDAG